MKNATFWKAIRLLSHPAALAALVLLLVNDHVLRQYWPSWVTGKLGDCAWLFFAPYALAALLAALIPPRVPRHEKLVGWLAFGLTGGVFALAKTWPAFHEWLVGQAEALLRSPVALRRDPTDLIALPALIASAWLWKRQGARAPAFDAAGWVALPLAALLTLANSAAPNYGIDCLALQDSKVVAFSSHESFVSENGGLDWQRVELYRSEAGCRDTWDLPNDGPDVSWQLPPAYASTSQAERVFYEKTRSGNVYYRPGPLDVQVEPVTTNIVYAMGHEGVLVHTADDEWVWATVGPYRRVEFDRVRDIFALIGGEIVLAAGFGLLCVSTLVMRVFRSRLRTLDLVIAWGVWGVAAFVVFPLLVGEFGGGYLSALFYLYLVPAALFILGSSVYAVTLAYARQRRLLLRILPVGVTGAVLFWLPFLLWVFDALPNYLAADAFAFALGVLVLILGGRWVRGAVNPVES